MNILRTLITMAILSSDFLPVAVYAEGKIVGWGHNSFFRFAGIPLTASTTGLVELVGADLCNVVAISAAGRGLALCEHGRVFGWLHDDGGVPIPPKHLTNVVAIAAANRHGVALNHDGTVAVWGDSTCGKTAVPAGLSNVVAISAGFEHCLALRRDGTLVGWGKTRTPSGVSNLVAIAASHSWGGRNVAVKGDGTVIEWDNRSGTPHIVPDLSNAVAVASGALHRLALLSDGTVFGWGFNGSGEATGVPTTNVPYTGRGLVKILGNVLSNVVAIAASGTTVPAGGYSLALKSDGTLVAWGNGWFDQTHVPAGLSNVVAISAGETFCLAITTNPAVAARFRR